MSRHNAGASLRWKLAVSDAVSVEIDYRDRDTVLHFALTEIVQMRSPFRIIIDVVGHMLGEEDVSGIPTIHHPLREANVETGSPLSHQRKGHAPNRIQAESQRHDSRGRN